MIQNSAENHQKNDSHSSQESPHCITECHYSCTIVWARPKIYLSIINNTECNSIVGIDIDVSTQQMNGVKMCSTYIVWIIIFKDSEFYMTQAEHVIKPFQHYFDGSIGPGAVGIVFSVIIGIIGYFM